MAKKTTYEDSGSADSVEDPIEDVPVVPVLPYLTLNDGGRPIFLRKAAVDAFYALGEPATQIRVVLRGGEAIIVNWTEAAKLDLLAAIG